MATKSRTTKSKSSLISASSFQPAIALIAIGLTCIGAAFYVGHSNASGPTATTIHDCVPRYVAEGVTDRTDLSHTASANHVAWAYVSTGQGGEVRVTMKAGRNCWGKQVSLVTYQSPSASGLPLDQQKIFAQITTNLNTSESKSTHMVVKMPDCLYQWDLAYGPVLPPGGSYHAAGHLIDGKVGGNRSCAAAPAPAAPAAPATPTSPANPAAPAAPAAPAPASPAAPTGTTTDTTPVPDTTPAGTTPVNEAAAKEPVTILPDTGDSNLTLLGVAFVIAGSILAWNQKRKAPKLKRK